MTVEAGRALAPQTQAPARVLGWRLWLPRRLLRDLSRGARGALPAWTGRSGRERKGEKEKKNLAYWAFLCGPSGPSYIHYGKILYLGGRDTCAPVCAGVGGENLSCRQGRAKVLTKEGKKINKNIILMLSGKASGRRRMGKEARSGRTEKKKVGLKSREREIQESFLVLLPFGLGK